MSEEPQLALTARLLDRGRQIERLSDGISLLALGVGLASLLVAARHPVLTGTLCALLLILGLAQKYHALRVALDADLIGALATDTGRLGSRTRAFDQALHDLGLKRSGHGRDWLARCRAALRLLQRQAICFGLQVLLALSGLLILPWLPLAA